MRRGWIAALLLALTACGGGGSGGDGADSKSAADIADGLKGDISTITKTVEITEDNDPNDAIGRPGQYSQAISIYDSRTGAKIEVWDSESDAQDRADYIQDTLKATKILGSEYDYVDSNVILRVTGNLKPSEADEYEKAFTG